jgi:hypothetical protein
LLNKHPDERFYSSSEILETLAAVFPQLLGRQATNHGRRLTRVRPL